MELLDYIEPVALDKPSIKYDLGDQGFFRNIFVHTENNPIKNLEDFKVALLGLSEDRACEVSGASKAPNQIRQKLFQLSFEYKDTIIDLGNLKQGSTLQDTYAGLREVVTYLTSLDIYIILFGGTNDLVKPVFDAFEKVPYVNYTAIDARLNFQPDVKDGGSEYYLNDYVERSNFNYNQIGSQNYLNNSDIFEYLDDKGGWLFRLGEIRKQLREAEPILRDSHIVGVDVSSVKQLDAPGQYFPSPNGFNSEEICQLAWYAGMGSLGRVFYIGEVNPDFDLNDQTSNLASQVIWHCIKGVHSRKLELPEMEVGFKKYVVSHNNADTKMVFYKSELTHRWWFKLEKTKFNTSIFISCSHKTYLEASGQDIPDLWWRSIKRFS